MPLAGVRTPGRAARTEGLSWRATSAGHANGPPSDGACRPATRAALPENGARTWRSPGNAALCCLVASQEASPAGAAVMRCRGRARPSRRCRSGRVPISRSIPRLPLRRHPHRTALHAPHERADGGEALCRSGRPCDVTTAPGPSSDRRATFFPRGAQWSVVTSGDHAVPACEIAPVPPGRMVAELVELAGGRTTVVPDVGRTAHRFPQTLSKDRHGFN